MLRHLLQHGQGLAQSLAASSRTTLCGGAAAPPLSDFVRHATKKAAGVTSNTSDSPGQRLGVKVTTGTLVHPGFVLVRQRGTTFHAGANVMVSKDHTLHALISGDVAFSQVMVPGRKRRSFRTLVNVVPSDERGHETLVEVTAQIQKRYLDSYAFRQWRKDSKSKSGTDHGALRPKPENAYAYFQKVSATIAGQEARAARLAEAGAGAGADAGAGDAAAAAISGVDTVVSASK